MRDGMIKDTGGGRHWYLNGKRHREDGPAVEWANGDREWYRNGKWHREDGPAIEWTNDYREWWLNDIEYTEEEYEQAVLVYKWGLSVDA